MKTSLKALLAAVLLSSASSSFAFWGNNKAEMWLAPVLAYERA